MDWFKKHTDMIVVLGAILSSVLWMNGQFNSISHKFSHIEKDMAVIKTVLIMKDVMPRELATQKE